MRVEEAMHKPIRQVAEAILESAPPREVERRAPAGLAQPGDDALAHLGRSLPGERHRENVIRIHARAEQVHIPLDEDARLPGTRRRLQHHIPGGIDSVPTGDRVGRETRDSRCED